MLKKIALVAVALALAAVVPVAGQNPKFVDVGIQLGFLGTLTPPEVTCEGGEPTGLSFPQCSEDTKHITGRNEVQTWGPVPMPLSASLPDQLKGLITFVVNCNMSAQYRGPCFGTFEWDVPGGGKWEGTWIAPVMDLMTYESRLSMVGYGVGGEIDGLQIKFDGASAPWDWFISGTVRIR